MPEGRSDWNESFPDESKLGRIQTGLVGRDDSPGPMPGVNNPVPGGRPSDSGQ